MNGSPTVIEHPFGISVFGSALLRVQPDFATIHAAITRLEKKPSDAFSKAKDAAHAVSDFLRQAPIKESGLSRISLSQPFRFVNNERQPLGYQARIALTIVLSAMDQIESVVSGLVESGANEITSTEFHTAKLKELRINARQLAMKAAREKAEIYATAGGVKLGEILHIQDVDPNILRQEFHSAAGRGLAPVEIADAEPDQNSLDPNAIQVGAAVVVAYLIGSKPGSARKR